MIPNKLDSLFRPRSVAVIGASTDPACVGRQVLDNLLEFGYTGRVYAVNPKAREIGGVPCYPSARDIEEAPELGLVVVPRAAVLTVVEDCVARSVRALAVITAGFRELDQEGAELEAELRRRVSAAGIPLLGPNCMGLFNTDSAVRLNLTFAPAQPRPGNVAFLSQSGALCAIVLPLAENSGLGFSLFASLGNEADVTHRELLEYAAADERTGVIMLYLETFERAPEFLRVAQRVTRSKPIVCLKGGRTEAGARAAGSHTGARATGARAFEAVMRQSGVVLVDTMEQMLDAALVLAHAPQACGRRVRLLTNAGGPGVLAADVLVERGLSLPPLPPERQATLREFLPPQAPVTNPVDLTAAGSPAMYRRAGPLMLDDPETNALLAIFVTPPRVSAPDVLEEIQKVAEESVKPVVACLPAQEALLRGASQGKLAALSYPESAALALAALIQYSEWRKRPPGRVVRYAVERERVRKLLAQAQREGRKVLDAEESLEALDAYGIAVARYALVREPEQLASCAQRIGFPLALKAVSPRFLHKTEAAGVVLNIRNLTELWSAYRRMTKRLKGWLRGVLLQEMAPCRRELILGFRRDPQGTPLLMAGLGGIFVEALEAVTMRVLPVTDQDVREMLAEIPGARVLGAFRGMQPVDFSRLEESLLRLAQLATDFEDIAEIDINPFAASAEARGSKAVDARILLGQ